MQTRNAEELIRHFRDAQREGNKYKMEAVLQKLANDANDNEVLNDYGYSSGFEGYQKFFENEVKDHAGISEQEALRIANDVSFINEERNHWNTARTVTVDSNTGQFKWKSEAEHVGEALAEIGKWPWRRRIQAQLVDRLFASMLGVDSWKLQRGKLDESDFQNLGPIMDELNTQKIFIDDTSGASMSEMRAKARRLQMEHGLDVLMIDYLQLISLGKAAYAANRVQEMSEISRSVKGLARELHIPIIALSQLSRAVENRPGAKIPQLSDLRESGSIEQDADIVMMIYREDYYEEDSDRKGVTDLYIRKHRNGPTGHIELMFRKEQMKFFDIDRQHRAPNPGAVQHPGFIPA